MPDLIWNNAEPLAGIISDFSRNNAMPVQE
jgi:hypothetical protein